MVQWSKSSLRAFQRRLLDLHLRLGLVEGGDGCVVVGIRDEFAIEQRLRALRFHLLQFEGGFGVGQVPFGLMNGGLEDGRVQLGDDLVGFDQGIVVGEQLGDVAGNLAADLDVEDGIQLAAGGHHLGQIAAGDARSLILRRLGVVVLEVHHAAHRGAEHYQNQYPLRPAELAISCHNSLSRTGSLIRDNRAGWQVT